MDWTRRDALRHVLSGSLGSAIPWGGLVWTGLESAVGAITTASASVDLAAAGVRPENSPQANRVNLQRAISAAPPGAALHLPASEGRACRVETRFGWPQAVQISKPLTIRIDGALQATHAGHFPLPSYLFNVTAPRVRFEGGGRIIGPGTIDDRNAGTDETLFGLVRVAADDFTLTGVEIVTPPKVGLMLYQCRRARIVNARFTGGPRIYRDTGHFAIRANGGGDHVFEGNRFYPAPDGGMAVQCIMLVGSHGNLLIRNHATRPFEKLVYAFGDRNVAQENTVEGNRDFIPGLNAQGTYTAVIRFHGSNNVVERNRTDYCAGGAQMMDGNGHLVNANSFLNCGQSAISAYQGDLRDCTFTGNTCTRGPLAGFVAGSGIHLVADKGSARRLVVADNVVSGFSVDHPLEAVVRWRARSAYGLNWLIRPGIDNGRYYVTTNEGVSGPREPRWPDRPGETVQDGALRWVAVPYEGGQAGIAVGGGGPAKMIDGAVIRNNQISGGRVGLATRYLRNSTVSANRIDVTAEPLVDQAGGQNAWQGNTLRGAPARLVRK